MQPGDHIRVRRRFYTHHGVYAGYDQVIHFWHPHLEWSQAEVKKDALTIFADAIRPEVEPVQSPSDSASEVMKRAESKLKAKGSALHFKDSEAFVIWCRQGDRPRYAGPVSAGEVFRVLSGRPIAGPAFKERLKRRTWGSSSGARRVHEAG